MCKLNSRHEFLTEMSLNIAICHKLLMNYELSIIILEYLYSKEFEKLHKSSFLKVSILYELSDLYFLLNDFEKSLLIIDKAESLFFEDKFVCQKVRRYIRHLILIRIRILSEMGCLAQANKAFISLQEEADCEEENLLDIEKLNLQLLSSCYKEFEGEINKLIKTTSNSGTELCSQKQKSFLLLTRYYYEQLNIEKFEEYLNRLARLFKDFDHFKLMKNNEFLCFIRYEILHLILKHKYDHALNRVLNILNHLNIEVDKYRFLLFTLLKCEILEKSNKIDQSLTELKTQLIRFGFDDFESIKFRHYILFVKLHYQMAKCYYKIQKFNNSIKCLKLIKRQYFDHKGLFIKENRLSLCLSKINLLLAKNYKKLNNFDKYEHYLSKTEEINAKLFKNAYHPNNLKLYLERVKSNTLFSKYNVAKGFLDRAELIIKRKYGKRKDNFFNTSLFYKNQAIYFREIRSYNECLTAYQKSIAIIDKTIANENDTRLTAVINEMAGLCVKFDKMKIAEGYLKKCERINRKLENGELVLAETYFYWGNFYKKLSVFDLAIQFYSKSIKLFSEIYCTELHSDIIKCYFQIADIYCIKKKLNDGFNLLEECLNNLRMFHKSQDTILYKKIDLKLKSIRTKMSV